MQTFERGADALGIVLDDVAVEGFERLLALLRAEGSRYNLTSLREPDAIVERHFLESLALGLQLAKAGLLRPGETVLDLGSGAGFPGLPLKLIWRDIDLALLEATGKKAHFIKTAVDRLGLAGTRVLTGRAETLARDPALRGSYDVVVARAVTALPALVELALPFLHVGGKLAAVKGSRAPEEICAAGAALRLCGGRLLESTSLGPGSELVVVMIEKIRETPAGFPRRPGQPAAHPLRD